MSERSQFERQLRSSDWYEVSKAINSPFFTVDHVETVLNGKADINLTFLKKTLAYQDYLLRFHSAKHELVQKALDSVDELIVHNEKYISTLRQYRKALIRDLYKKHGADTPS